MKIALPELPMFGLLKRQDVFEHLYGVYADVANDVVSRHDTIRQRCKDVLTLIDLIGNVLFCACALYDAI